MKKTIVGLAMLWAFGMSGCGLFGSSDAGDPISDSGTGKGGSGSPGVQNTVPRESDFTITGSGTTYFDGEMKTVAIAANPGRTEGAISTYYEGIGGTNRPKTDAPPISLGTYSVTFDVEAAGDWEAANGLSAGTLTIADGTPDAPQYVQVSPASPSSVLATWYSVQRADRYDVYYLTESSGGMALAGTVEDTTYTHTGLDEGATYWYYVTAVSDRYGVSGYSDLKAVVMRVPVAPNAVSAEAVSKTSVKLKWSPVEGADKHKIYYAKGAETAAKVPYEGSCGVTECSVGGLVAETEYYFFVTATNALGEGEFSEPAAAKTLTADVPDAPTNLRHKEATSGTKVEHFLLWDPVPATECKEEMFYDVMYAIGGSNVFEVLCGYSGSCCGNDPKSQQLCGFYDLKSDLKAFPLPNVNLWNVKPNTLYRFYVRARCPVYSEKGSLLGILKGHRSEILTIRTTEPLPPDPPLPSTPGADPGPVPPGGGAGEKPCTACGGSGQCSYNRYPCYGTGEIVCPYCSMQLLHTCSECHGSGFTKCTSCKGSGKCHKCDGTGKM